MATPKVPTNYQPIFEGYWKQCDPKSTGKVNASEAAAFLKKSQIKQSILHQIWNQADPKGRGYLEKKDFYLALQLVAVSQSGKEPNVSNISERDPLPTFSAQSDKPWVIGSEERAHCLTVFNGLHPEQGKLSGDKAKAMFLKSGLANEILGKIWSLSDVDEDGCLTINEFAIAMHLIQRCKSGEPVPPVLPPSLRVVAVGPPMGRTSGTEGDHDSWLITAEMKAKYDGYFANIDKDKDGFVTGGEAKGLFMASNLPQGMLAKIWGLVDVQTTGKLNADQFAVAMYLISEKVRGADLPSKLPANLVPPSMRETRKMSLPATTVVMPTFATSSVTSSPVASATVSSPSGTGSISSSSIPPATGAKVIGSLSNSSLSTSLTPQKVSEFGSDFSTDFPADFSAIKELDSLNTELDKLTKEKETLQQDIQSKQSEIAEAKDDITKLKEDLGEAKRLCQELATQKVDAQQQLDRMDEEKITTEKQIEETRRKVEEMRTTIKQLGSELEGKKEAIKSQNEELEKASEELQELKKEESKLKGDVEKSKRELQAAQQRFSANKSEIGQLQLKISSLKEDQRQVTSSLSLYSGSNSTSALSGTLMGAGNDMTDDGHSKIETDAFSAVATAGSGSPQSSLSAFSEFENKEESSVKGSSDPFATSSTGDDPFTANTSTGFGVSSFATASESDPFKTPTASSDFSDPFGGSTDPFKVNDPFSSRTDKKSASPASDPFNFSAGTGSTDPFKSPTPAGDPFNVPTNAEKNPFGGDPFSSKSTEFSNDDPFASGVSGGTGSDPFGRGSGSTAYKDNFLDPFNSDNFGGWSKGGGSDSKSVSK